MNKVLTNRGGREYRRLTGCWGGEETGENAPASWATDWGSFLDGYRKKEKPRPK